MGADYRKAHLSLITGHTDHNGGPAANSTNFICCGDHSTIEVRVQGIIPVDCTFDRLMVGTNASPGAGETYTYTVRINGGPTILTCQIAGAVLMDASDLVNAVQVNAGDRFCVQVVSSLNAVVSFHGFGLRVRI